MGRVIRRATPDDLEVVVRYNAALATESEGKTLDDAILRRGITAVLGDVHKGFYTLVEDDTEVVGQTLVTYEWSDWRNGWYWWIQSVYVRADARRTGVFRSLYDHLQTAAMLDPTVIGLRLYVEHDNERALKTYQSLGMELEPYKLMGRYPLPGKSNAIG